MISLVASFRILYKQKLNKISKVLGKTTLSNLLKNNKEKEQNEILS